jgi:hypothetical protein
MKKLISPKDILFFSMLFLIITVGYIGFTQSARLKSKSNQQTSEVIKNPKSIQLFK